MRPSCRPGQARLESGTVRRGTRSMHHASDILLSLFIIYAAAQTGAEIATRPRLPGVAGEIAAGCIAGPSVLGPR